MSVRYPCLPLLLPRLPSRHRDRIQGILDLKSAVACITRFITGRCSGGNCSGHFIRDYFKAPFSISGAKPADAILSKTTCTSCGCRAFRINEFNIGINPLSILYHLRYVLCNMHAELRKKGEQLSSAPPRMLLMVSIKSGSAN